MDEIYVYAAGATVDFSGIKATWVVKMSVGDLEAAAKASQTPYQPLTNRQAESKPQSRYTFPNSSKVRCFKSRGGWADDLYVQT